MPAIDSFLRRAAVAALACLACTAMAALPDPVREALRRLDLPEDSIGLVVMPLRGFGRTLSHRADLPMQPGSSMKLVTSVVALDHLGPNHRGFTELRSAAAQEGDMLRGDLVLRGGADPDLGVPQLWALLQELRWAGIREITGDLIVDRSRWLPARMDLGVPPFDEAPEFAYNGIPDAVQLAENLVTLEIAAGATEVQTRLLPPLERVEIDNRLTAADLPCRDWDDHWTTPVTTSVGDVVRITIDGPFPRRCTQRPSLQLVDRLVLADRLVRHLWTQLGGSWRGRAREGVTPADSRLLARRLSRPWGEVLRNLNKRSDNPLSRMLFLEIGARIAAEHAGTPTRELAEREVRRWFSEQGIDAAGIVLDNGSGLSRSERIAPRQMARLLEVALNGRHASDLLMSLPTAGVDGTMGHRLRASAAAGWARVKTGTLRNVVALAGLVPDAEGRPWVMVAIINHERAGVGRPVLDALVDWIASEGPHAPAWPRIGPQGDGP